MKALVIASIMMLLCSGCATYRYHHGDAPYDAGYVVSRDDVTIPEYTLGPDNSVPERSLAQKRFQRRRSVVEDYYKRMGEMENRFTGSVWNPLRMFVKIAAGVFRLPFIAVSDYRSEHNAAYREMIINQEAQKESAEESRIRSLRSSLAQYVDKDLVYEGSEEYQRRLAREQAALDTVAQKQEEQRLRIREKALGTDKPLPKARKARPVKKSSVRVQPQTLVAAQDPEQAKEEAIVTQEINTIVSGSEFKELVSSVKETKAVSVKKERAANFDIRAKITARPARGISPLTVHFSAAGSRSGGARIVSYEWDFGDGDTAAKSSAVNTFYSGSVEPQIFHVTLIVADAQGNSDRAAVDIEVLNK